MLSASSAAAPGAAAVALVALMGIKGVGRRTALQAMPASVARCDLAEGREAFLSACARLPDLCADGLAEAWHRSREHLTRDAAAGILAVAFHEDAYPARLRCIPDPSPVLFVKGVLSALDAARSIAIIGTRRPTAYGAEVAIRSGRAAAREGLAVVSGLALGCDTGGHAGCLDGEGVTAAVLAHGLDRVYPAANGPLAARILGKCGCLVSEYPTGTPPMPRHFFERDRIQSGLSDGVLVVEAGVTSGTMHTVRFARSQGRRLAAVDHPGRWRGEAAAAGNRRIIENGWAVPIADGGALTEFLRRLAPCSGKDEA